MQWSKITIIQSKAGELPKISTKKGASIGSQHLPLVHNADDLQKKKYLHESSPLWESLGII